MLKQSFFKNLTIFSIIYQGYKYFNDDLKKPTTNDTYLIGHEHKV